MKKNYLMLGLATMSLLAVGCSTGNDDSGMRDLYAHLSSVYSTADATSPNGMPTLPQGSGDKFEDFTDNPFVQTSEEPTSTFSVDADGASYGIVRRYLTNGLWDINPSCVRIEELLKLMDKVEEKE